LNNRSSNIHLHRAFNKHGLENFTFSILKFCANDTNLPKEQFRLYLTELEQVYLDLIANKYNINHTAGKTRLGAKHSAETKALFSKINGFKFLGKTHTPEYKEKLRQRMRGANNPLYGKPVTEENKNSLVLFLVSLFIFMMLILCR
jgi:group I intron endonuclease